MIRKLLRKNTSPSRVAAFLLSNFIGLAIVLGALQFYLDARSIWTGSDSFISSDFLVVNKKVTSANTFGTTSTAFSEEEIADIESQPWVRSLGRFRSSDFRVSAAVRQGGRSMSTSMFFESIPDSFVDVPASQWSWQEGGDAVPIIISKDYLTLYNFGFATSAGLPQMSEGLMSGIPLELTLESENGDRREQLYGRVAGYSNRLNTILVPDEFLKSRNDNLGGGRKQAPSRLIIDVNSPGDTAIKAYLDEHSLEVAGDKSGASAAFLLKVVMGVVGAIGVVITLLSVMILALSLSLLMEKNRDTLHRLLMLGYDPAVVGRPYVGMVIWSSIGALVLALIGVFLLRLYYIAPLRGLGGGAGALWMAPLVGCALTSISILANTIAIRRRVLASFR